LHGEVIHKASTERRWYSPYC